MHFEHPAAGIAQPHGSRQVVVAYAMPIVTLHPILGRNPNGPVVTFYDREDTLFIHAVFLVEMIEKKLVVCHG